MPRREQLEQLIQDDPDDIFLHYALAMAYGSEGNVAEAITRLKQVIERDPHYVAAYFQMGQYLVNEGDLEQARHVISEGIAVADQVGDAHAGAEMRGYLETL